MPFTPDTTGADVWQRLHELYGSTPLMPGSAYQSVGATLADSAMYTTDRQRFQLTHTCAVFDTDSHPSLIE